MVAPGRMSRDSGKDISGHRDRRRKKERDNTRDLEEETCTYEDDINREMTSHDSGFTSGLGSGRGARQEIVEEKKKPTVRRKLVTENSSQEKSSTHVYQNGDPSARPSTSGVGGISGERAANGMRDPASWPSTSGASGSQRDRIENGMRDPSTRPSTSGISTSTPRGTINDTTEMPSQDSELGKRMSGLGARKKEKVEKKEQKKKPLTHKHDQNRDVSVVPTSGVGSTSGGRVVDGMSSMVPLSDHLNSIIRSKCLTVMKDVLTTALEKVEALENKAAKRTIEYEQISPAETPKKKRELSPASSVEATITVTTVQRPGSAVGQYPAVPCPGTSDHHLADRNLFVQTEQNLRVVHQYSSIVPFENCVFFEPAHVPEGSRSVTSVTSSQFRQQWMTIDNDNHSVVSGISSWRRHRTTDDDNDSDGSGTKSPQSEKKSFFERQNLCNADEELAEDVDLSCNLLECSINGRSPRSLSRETHNGSISNEMYDMSSIKINLMSTKSYVGSPSDRRPPGHAASSPSRSQPPPNANRRPIIRQPRLLLPASPPQTVCDAGARNCRCPVCGSVWRSELELEEHYFEHLLGNRSCVVGGCEYTCSSRNELRRHIRAAHLRMHTCRRCGKAYLMASTLERHLRQCLPYRQCSLCRRAGVDDAPLCDHMASAHGAVQIACNRRPELRYYVCNECRFATTSRTVALDHCQRHILGEINLNITLCEICDLLFVTGDLHFLMHAVDDSFNRKSFQVVDFDWTVSLNARRQLESSLKKIKLTKAIRASIDEETSNVKSNVEETNIETNDKEAPQTETQLKSQEIYSDDSLQENNNNIDLNQNEFTVTDTLIETKLSPIRDNINKMWGLMQNYLSKQENVSTMAEPVQSVTLIERPLEQQTSQSKDNFDNNYESLPSTSTAELQNQNAALYTETPTITNYKESNVETNDITAPPSEIHLENQVTINDNQARDDSAEENTLLQENNTQTFLDHTNELIKPGTVSKNQSSNTTEQEDVLEASTMKEPVQSETLTERPLDQQTTVVAKRQSNDNVENNNQSLSSSSTAEVLNQNVALYETTPMAITTVEELNDNIALPSEIHLENQVVINDNEARVDSVEENKSLQEKNKQTFLDHTNELIERGTVSKNRSSNMTQQEAVLEANTMKVPVQSETMIERLLEQQNTAAISQPNDNVVNNKSLSSSLATEVQNQTAALDGETSTATNFEVQNVKMNDMISLSSKMHHDQEVCIDLVVENTSPQRTINVNHTNKLNKPNLPNVEENIDKIKYLVQEIKELIQKANKIQSPEKSAIMVELNKFHVTDILIETNLSQSGDNIHRMQDLTHQYLDQRGTVSINQSPNTTQQEDVLEASTTKIPVQSETLIERPLEQQNTVAMSQSNDNVDNDNQNLPSSSTPEVQNQIAAFDEETPNTRFNFEDSNDGTNNIMVSSNETHIESQVSEENISLQEIDKQTFLDHTNEKNEPNLARNGNDSKTQLSNTTKHQQILEANTMKVPEQSETLVERHMEQQTTVEISQSNDNVKNNKSLPSSLAVGVQDQIAALNEDSSTAVTNFQESHVETNRKTVNNDDVKMTTEGDVGNDQNRIKLFASESETLNQAYKNINKTSTIGSDLGVEQENSAGEPEFSANKLDESAIITENKQKVNTNQTKVKNILITYSHHKKDKNDEPSVDNNDTVKVALGSIDINITISGTKSLAITAEEANSKNVVLDKATLISVEEAMSSVSALEETNAIEVLKNAPESHDLTMTEQSIRLSDPTEEPHTEKLSTKMPHDGTTASETKNSTNTINENIIKENKASDHTRAEETTNPGSPAEESNSKDISDEVQYQTINEETKSSSFREKTDSEEVLEKGRESQNQTSIDKTNSSENTTKETDVENSSQNFQDSVEKSSEYEKNVTDAKDETSSKTAASTSKKGRRANRGRGRPNNNNENIIKVTQALDHTRAEETTNPGSPAEESNLKEISDEVQYQTINEETKSLSRPEKTDSEEVLEKGQESQNQPSMDKTNSLQNTKETDVENHSQNSQDLNTVEKSKEYVKSVTGAKDETSSKTESNSKDISDEVQYQTINIETKSLSRSEKTDTEEVLEKVQESQNETRMDETNSLETTSKETVVKNHSQNSQDTVEKSNEYEKNVTDAKDKTSSKTAASTSKKGRRANRGRGRPNNNNENIIKVTQALDHTRAEETTNPGSPAEESNSKEISDEVQYQTINEETKSLSRPEKTDSEEVLEKGQESQNETSIDKTTLENTTKESDVENHSLNSQDTVEKSKQYEKNGTDVKDATSSKTAATTSKKGQPANRGRRTPNNNNENIIKETKASDHTRAEETTNPGSPAEESKLNDISDDVQYPINEETKSSSITDKNISEEVLEKGQESQNQTSIDKTNSLENTTKETDLGNLSQNSQDTVEKSKQCEKKITDAKDGTSSKTAATTSKKGQHANREKGRPNNNNENIIKETKALDHTRAEDTTNPGSPAEESNSKDISDVVQYQTINEETKSLSRSEKTDSEEVLEMGQESQNETSIDKSTSLENTTKETGVKNHSQNSKDLNTVEKSKEYVKSVTDAKDETSSKTESNLKDISDEVQYQTIDEKKTKSLSRSEKTDSEVVLEKGQESQNEISIDKTTSLENTTKETDVENHSLNSQDTVEKSKQYEKIGTDAKDETSSKTAATTGKKRQHANRERGRANNNNENIIKETKASDHTRAEETTNQGSPAEESKSNDISDDVQYPINEETKSSSITEKNISELLEKGQESQNQTSIDKTNSLENTTKETDLGNLSQNSQDTVEKSKQCEKKNTDAKDGTSSKTAATTSKKGQQANRERGRPNNNNENIIKETKALDNTRAEDTINPGSPAEESNSKDISDDVQYQTINEETKSLSRSEKTDSEEVLEMGQESQNETSIDKSTSLENTTKETGVKNHSQNSKDLNSVENSNEYVKSVTDAKDETSSKTEFNLKDISDEVQYQTIDEKKTKSLSRSEKTDSEEVLEKGQESQNEISIDKTTSLENTTKETDVENHSLNSQDTVEKSKQYEKIGTDAKDETSSKTAATTGKKRQHANRERGRANNNNENIIKETKASDHTRAEETTNQGSPAEESNSNDISDDVQYSINEETKSSSITEKNISEVLEKGQESQNQTSIDKTNSLENTTKETVVGNLSQNSQDTVEKSKQCEKNVTDAKDETSSKTAASTSKKGRRANRGRWRPNNNNENIIKETKASDYTSAEATTNPGSSAEESNSKDISDDVQYQPINEETKSLSRSEKTDSEEVLEKGQESQNETSIDKTTSLESTPKETDVKYHSQNSQDTVEKSNEYEKNMTDAKDETSSKTAASTSKKGRRANRGRGRHNDKKKR